MTSAPATSSLKLTHTMSWRVKNCIINNKDWTVPNSKLSQHNVLCCRYAASFRNQRTSKSTGAKNQNFALSDPLQNYRSSMAKMSESIFHARPARTQRLIRTFERALIGRLGDWSLCSKKFNSKIEGLRHTGWELKQQSLRVLLIKYDTLPTSCALETCILS